MIGVNLPFDRSVLIRGVPDAILSPHLQFTLPYVRYRHDWTVDRCGTEVKYVIDYYDSNNTYWIDAR